MCKKGSCDYGQKAVFSLEKFDKHELVLASQPPLSLELALAFKPVLLHDFKPTIYFPFSLLGFLSFRSQLPFFLCLRKLWIPLPSTLPMKS